MMGLLLIVIGLVVAAFAGFSIPVWVLIGLGIFFLVGAAVA